MNGPRTGPAAGWRRKIILPTSRRRFERCKFRPSIARQRKPFRSSPSEIEQKFAAANHVPAGDFRVSCSGTEFVAIEACLTKDLQYRQCGSGLRDCRAPQVTIQPTP